ncbi:N-acetylgalactosamine-6-sulfatase-like isoform X1 [Dysidea avara]|uniref:N-acetylgalactosamine-6-sulfatase-like isoform X1 n=2 Tax=Dysidea avara TaxID=196820 RepID=UPI00331E5AE5
MCKTKQPVYYIPLIVLVVLLLSGAYWSSLSHGELSLPFPLVPDQTNTITCNQIDSGTCGQVDEGHIDLDQIKQNKGNVNSVHQDQVNSINQNHYVREEEKRLREDTANVTHMMPNIIFAMADDVGWGDVQYNNGSPMTPNLNNMAKSPNSILLQRHYSGAPVCSPTRGTVLTGRNHNRYCLWSANAGLYQHDFVKPETMPLPLSEISVADVMRRAGYATALFGKWHMGDFKKVNSGSKLWPVSHPGQHGFDQWQATERSGPTCTFNCGCFENAECRMGHQTRPFPCLNYYTNGSTGIEPWPDPTSGDDSQFIWSLGKKFIKEQVNLKKPFFLYLPFHAVHQPFVATEHYESIYLNQKYNLEQVDYYGTISAMDDVVGNIRQLLKDLGIRDNTVLWFTSDNGPEINTPGVTNGLRGRKLQLYEGGIRVPGIIEWPNFIERNRVSWFPVVTNDFLPTVYDILGVKPSDDQPLDGISILPLLQGKVSHRNHSIFWAFNVNGDFSGQYDIAVSGDQYKLIAGYENGKVHHHQLYDLLHDIGETKDLKDQYPALCEKLLGEVEEWRLSVMNSVARVGCLDNI